LVEASVPAATVMACAPTPLVAVAVCARTGVPVTAVATVSPLRKPVIV
jgi:hypothetical protein